MTGSTTELSADVRPSARRSRTLLWHPHLLDTASPVVGPRDSASLEEVLAALPQLSVWPPPEPNYGHARGNAVLRGARVVLSWLLDQPGEGWQARWQASGADSGVGWTDPLLASQPRSYNKCRNELTAGLRHLILSRAIAPGYDFLVAYRANMLFRLARQVRRPELFAQAAAAAAQLGVAGRRREDALAVLTKIVLCTGRDLDQLNGEDLLAYRAWEMRRYGFPKSGVSLAWAPACGIADLGEGGLREAVRVGQRPTSELVDAYQLRCVPVRDLLVRYLDERRPGLDYSSLRD